MCSVVRIMSVEDKEICLKQKLGLVGMKGKCGTCKVTAGDDVCVCLLCYKSYHVLCTSISGAICDACLMK